jgi:hypothetical protein
MPSGLALSTKRSGLQARRKMEKSHDVLTKGLILRSKALALLQEAQALDGLKPFTVTHHHSYGASTYVLWAETQPSEDEAEAVLDAEFEPDRDETLEIEDNFTLEEMTGVATTSRLQDIQESFEPAEHVNRG